MSFGTPLTPALLSLASIVPSVNFRRGSIQESLTTIWRGGFPGECICAPHTIVPHPCIASEIKRRLSTITSLPTKAPVHATRKRFLPSACEITVSSNPISQSCWSQRARIVVYFTRHVLNTGLHLFVPQLLFTNTEVRHRRLIVSLHYTNCNTTRSFF